MLTNTHLSTYFSFQDWTERMQSTSAVLLEKVLKMIRQKTSEIEPNYNCSLELHWPGSWNASRKGLQRKFPCVRETSFRRLLVVLRFWVVHVALVRQYHIHTLMTVPGYLLQETSRRRRPGDCWHCYQSIPSLDIPCSQTRLSSLQQNKKQPRKRMPHHLKGQELVSILTNNAVIPCLWPILSPGHW